MGQRAIPSWISRHSYHSAEQTVKNKKLDHRVYTYLSPETKKANWNTTNKFLSEETIFLARNWPVGMQVIVQQNQKTNIKAYATWAGPVGRATMIGGDVIAVTKRSPNQELALK